MRLDQEQRELPGFQVKKFRRFAICFREAAVWIDQFDTIHPTKNPWQVVEPEGLEAIAVAAGRNFGDVLTASFIDRSYRNRDVSRKATKNVRAESLTIEKSIMANPGRVLWDLLLKLSLTFATAANSLEANKPKGGQKRHRVVPALLVNIADGYYGILQRKAAKSKTGPFRFVDDVFRSFGLDPEYLVDGYIEDAVGTWQKLPNDSPHNPHS